jgi:hypothetical protein
LQSANQAPHDFLVPITEDRHREDEVNDDMRGQQPRPLFYSARLHENFINDIPGRHARKHPDANPVRQPDATCDLAAHGTKR